MPLDSLLSLVEKLRERIEEHGSKLRQSEALTRYALIDPLLRELGWDTGDPDLVIPEYSVGADKADYALLGDGTPVMIVEAKSLGTSLQGEVLDQGLRYSLIKKTHYCSVTDGRHWKIYYDAHKPGDIDKKRLVQFDLKSQSAAEVCLKALTLWELKESGHAGTWQAPGVGLTPDHPAQQASPIPKTPLTSPSPPEPGWQPISELNPQAYDPPPVEIRFFDNPGVRVKTWKAILVEVAKWLEKNKLLTEDHCPIKIPGESWRTTKYIAHTEAVHSNGKPFRDYTQVGSLYIANSSGKAVAWAIRLIEHVGQDPAQFKVRFS